MNMFKHWLSEEDKKIDELNGIERKPLIGLLISVIGTVLFWSLIYWIWVSL